MQRETLDIMESIRSWRAQLVPFLPAARIFGVGLTFGMSKDFGLFLIGLIVLPVTLIAAIAGTIATLRTTGGRSALAAVALLRALPLGYFVGLKQGESLQFLAWAPFHYTQLRYAVSQPAIIVPWNSWGWPQP